MQEMQYIPLTLFNPDPKKTKAQDFELRKHLRGSDPFEKKRTK